MKSGVRPGRISESPGVEVELRGVLVGTNSHWLRKVALMQLLLHLGDPVLLHDEKIRVEFTRGIVVFVVTHIRENRRATREMDRCSSG